MSHVIFPNFDEPESTRFHGVCFTRLNIYANINVLKQFLICHHHLT